VSTEDKIINVKQSTALYDIDLTGLPTFDKHWFAAHTLAIVMLSSVATTSASMLWHTSCEDKNRKPLMKLSVDVFTHLPTMGNTFIPMMLMWLQRITGNANSKNQSRFMFIMVQTYFFMLGLGLGFNAYIALNLSWSIMLVKLQTAVAA